MDCLAFLLPLKKENVCPLFVYSFGLIIITHINYSINVSHYTKRFKCFKIFTSRLYIDIIPFSYVGELR